MSEPHEPSAGSPSARPASSGIAILIATASVTALAASLAPARRSLLATVAGLSACLAVDDMFMLHEEIGPEWLGIPELAFYLLYGVLAGYLAWCLWRARVDLAGLKVAMVFLGLSVLTDVFKVHGPFSYWLEDFTKLAGFGAWLVFWSATGRDAIVAARHD